MGESTGAPTQPGSLTFGRKVDFAESAWKHLTAHLPLSLAVRELMRLRALFEMGAIQKPILDVGCGDGLFWENLIQNIREGEKVSLKGLMGIDIDTHELGLASLRLQSRGVEVLQRDISLTSPLEGQADLSEQFKTVIANCSLEHVPKLEPALRNILGYLSPNGQFVLFVPAPNWTENLHIRQNFHRLSPRLGGLVGGCFDGFFQHRHLYPATVWKFLLEGMGFKVQTILGLGNQSANRLFERHLPTAFLTFIHKMIFKSYPGLLRSRPTPKSKLVGEFLQSITDGSIVQSDLGQSAVIEYFIICQK
ncbi:MAG: methyltransferase domain-containing protein [Bdellovibrionaceae bacterium]|nr:methyltransferase domain-containing protein [Bdellovibrionales bacterium]MCB9085946.1 methyltransferase domain-containing protein [Pseudobdellovibrionaceae bacterium]